ncbi:Ig-like domain-containing protein, partial [Dolosicoccus paucivorans]|uniref:Ig-like domain-containing protein n=1 Tax=Dolosicoccus paucivorans TaxID=84521 RepID=UPI00088930B7
MKKQTFLSNRVNKYSIRKFTVGTASILIGSLIFLGNDVSAAEADDNSSNESLNANIETSADEVNNDVSIEVSDEKNEVNKDEQATESLYVDTETSADEVNNDIQTADNTLEEDSTEELEKVTNEENGLEETETEDIEKQQETVVQKANELSENKNIEPISNLSPTGNNVSNAVNVTNLSLKNNKDSNEINPNQSGGLNLSFDIDVTDKAIRKGDFFEIQLSENLNFYGDSTSTNVPAFKNSAGGILAEGTYDKENHKFTYVFTDFVESSINIKGRANYSLWVDRKNVTSPGRETFSVDVAGDSTSTTLDVVFTNSHHNVDSFLTEVDPYGTKFEQTVYVNPHHQQLYGTKLTIKADWIGVNSPSEARINPENTTFVGYRVPKNSQPGFPSSFGFDKSKYEQVRLKPTFGVDSNGVEYVEFDFGNNTSDGTGFIVVMESKTTGKDGKLRVGAEIRTGDGKRNYWNNEHIVKPSLGEIDGEVVGTFQEHHNYYDVEKDFDGKEVSRKKNEETSYTGDQTKGTEEETFTTGKDEKDGYKFTKVT